MYLQPTIDIPLFVINRALATALVSLLTGEVRNLFKPCHTLAFNQFGECNPILLPSESRKMAKTAYLTAKESNWNRHR